MKLDETLTQQKHVFNENYAQCWRIKMANDRQHIFFVDFFFLFGSQRFLLVKLSFKVKWTWCQPATKKCAKRLSRLCVRVISSHLMSNYCEKSEDKYPLNVGWDSSSIDKFILVCDSLGFQFHFCHRRVLVQLFAGGATTCLTWKEETSGDERENSTLTEGGGGSQWLICWPQWNPT